MNFSHTARGDFNLPSRKDAFTLRVLVIGPDKLPSHEERPNATDQGVTIMSITLRPSDTVRSPATVPLPAPRGALHFDPPAPQPFHRGLSSTGGLQAAAPLRAMTRHGVSWASLLPDFMALALDEMDYAVVIVDAALRVLHANHQARQELVEPHPLQLHGASLQLPRPIDHRALVEVSQAASQRGIRKLIHVGDGAQRVGISVVPLSPDGSWQAPALMLALGRRQVCANLTVQGFARLHRLSPVESRVLEGLCRSVSPAEIAKQNGVALSTVRTQITNIRTKTGTTSIRDLVHQISMLPPLIGALRQAQPRTTGSDARPGFLNTQNPCTIR